MFQNHTVLLISNAFQHHIILFISYRLIHIIQISASYNLIHIIGVSISHLLFIWDHCSPYVILTPKSFPSKSAILNILLALNSINNIPTSAESNQLKSSSFNVFIYLNVVILTYLTNSHMVTVQWRNVYLTWSLSGTQHQPCPYDPSMNLSPVLVNTTTVRLSLVIMLQHYIELKNWHPSSWHSPGIHWHK